MGLGALRLVLTADAAPPSQQIIDQVEQLVALGVVRPGDPLPGAGTLGKDLEISRVTVQRAYDELIARGLAVAQVGSGTYIAAGADARVAYVARMFAPTITLAQNLHLSIDEVRQSFEQQLTRHFRQRSRRPSDPVPED
ncbi:MAG: hypothetical protein NVSMB21_25050 [Vulcanimicrobiaceae bacterium]